MNSLHKSIVIIIGFTTGFMNWCISQNSLVGDSAFFRNQLPAFQQWLEEVDLDQIAYVVGTATYSERLEIILRNKFQTDDSLLVAWKSLEQKNLIRSGIRMSEQLFDQASFLFQVSPDSLHLIIYGNEENAQRINMYFDDTFHAETNFLNIMEGGTFDIPLDELSFPNTPQYLNTTNKDSLRKITRSIRSFLYKYYEDKEGPWSYTAYIDTSRSYFNSFIIRITCLNKEILYDGEGYFEYIQIKVKVELVEDEIRITYDVKGSVASGIRCPEFRQGFYSAISDINYPGKMSDYAAHIRLKLEDYLIKN